MKRTFNISIWPTQAGVYVHAHIYTCTRKYMHIHTHMHTQHIHTYRHTTLYKHTYPYTEPGPLKALYKITFRSCVQGKQETFTYFL